MSALKLNVEVMAGQSIENAANEAINLSRQLHIRVGFKFNDVICTARPDGTAHMLVLNYYKALDSKFDIKIANSV